VSSSNVFPRQEWPAAYDFTITTRPLRLQESRVRPWSNSFHAQNLAPLFLESRSISFTIHSQHGVPSTIRQRLQDVGELVHNIRASCSALWREQVSTGTSKCGTSRTSFTARNRADYFKLYDYAVAGVRAALPNANVGGPASTDRRTQKPPIFECLFEALP